MSIEVFKKIKWKKVFYSALAYLAIAFVLRQIEVLLTLSFYMDPALSQVWSKFMMPEPGPPPWTFQMLSIVFTFCAGLVLAWMWQALKDFLPSKKWIRIISFADMMGALMLVFGFLPMILMFNLPLLLIFSWFITNLIAVILAAIAFEKIQK
jgi:hypothetical protein